MPPHYRTRLWQVIILLIAPAFAALAHFAVVRPQVQVAVEQVTLDEALAMPDAIWVDARAARRYEAGHIPGALLLNEQEWESLLGSVIEAWTPGQPVIIYCDGRGCEDSRVVAERLKRDLGVENIRTLKGGVNAWRNAGKPLEVGRGRNQ